MEAYEEELQREIEDLRRIGAVFASRGITSTMIPGTPEELEDYARRELEARALVEAWLVEKADRLAVVKKHARAGARAVWAAGLLDHYGLVPPVPARERGTKKSYNLNTHANRYPDEAKLIDAMREVSKTRLSWRQYDDARDQQRHPPSKTIKRRLGWAAAARVAWP
jgi:hypothetical protein